jgi:hypothetical protein
MLMFIRMALTFISAPAAGAIADLQHLTQDVLIGAGAS